MQPVPGGWGRIGFAVLLFWEPPVRFEPEEFQVSEKPVTLPPGSAWPWNQARRADVRGGMARTGPGTSTGDRVQPRRGSAGLGPARRGVSRGQARAPRCELRSVRDRGRRRTQTGAGSGPLSSERGEPSRRSSPLPDATFLRRAEARLEAERTAWPEGPRQSGTSRL